MKQLLKHATSKGICSEKEYKSILDTIYPGCNMLVFGLGYDSPMWLAANKDGKTLFIEDDVLWIDKCSVLPGIIKVSYRTEYWNNEKIYDHDTLYMPLPKFIENVRWDVIFVDGPVGAVQGRMKSIYNAYLLATKFDAPSTVFVHDYDRTSEKRYVDHFFKDFHKTKIDRLVKLTMKK